LPRLPPEIFPLGLFSVVQKAKLIISFAWNLRNFCLRAICRIACNVRIYWQRYKNNCKLSHHIWWKWL